MGENKPLPKPPDDAPKLDDAAVLKDKPLPQPKLDDDAVLPKLDDDAAAPVSGVGSGCCAAAGGYGCTFSATAGLDAPRRGAGETRVKFVDAAELPPFGRRFQAR